MLPEAAIVARRLCYHRFQRRRHFGEDLWQLHRELEVLQSTCLYVLSCKHGCMHNLWHFVQQHVELHSK
jgi:hypothetical protein